MLINLTVFLNVVILKWDKVFIITGHNSIKFYLKYFFNRKKLFHSLNNIFNYNTVLLYSLRNKKLKILYKKIEMKCNWIEM